MKRRPEPELMDSDAQTLAYAEADFEESNKLFTTKFLERFGSLPEHGRLIDLGCGPGDITIRLARALPGWSITGLDAGPNMLRHAEARLAAEGLEGRVSFHLAYLPDPELPAGAWDAVVSNSLLHHLPDPQVLWESIARLGTKRAAVQVMDLLRPASLTEAHELVERYAEGAPDILREDFHNSLLAAYTIGEAEEQMERAGLGHLRVEAVSDRHWMASGTLPR